LGILFIICPSKVPLILRHLWGTKFQGKLSSANGWYRVGAENNGYFPLVDFQNGNNLVSLKSVDTRGSTWLTRMEDHIVDLGNSGATVNGIPANMILDLRVQPGGIPSAQPLIQFGRNNNVTVIIGVVSENGK